MDNYNNTEARQAAPLMCGVSGQGQAAGGYSPWLRPGRETLPAPTPLNHCCCKKSMVEALRLLCNSELADIIDFERFAFLTDNFIVGARLVLLKLGTEEKDNLSNLDAKFKRFSPCDCDLIDIEGAVSYNVPIPFSLTDLAEQLTELIKNIIDILGEQTGILGTLIDILKALLELFDPEGFSEELLRAILTFLLNYFTTIPLVDTASLCAINAIAFQVRYVENAEAGDTTREKQTEENFQRAKDIFTCKLERGTCEDCAACRCKCSCDDCCCTESIMSELFSSNLSRRVTLTAGNLTLRDVLILGTKGDVLVLANDKKKRFYFVCANAVQFLE